MLGRSVRARVAGTAVLLCLLGAACGVQARADPPDLALERAPTRAAPAAEDLQLPPRPLVGAHYYHWYPGNWGHGTLRAQLDPPQEPVLGRYSSTDSAVAEQHIEWASAHGIDFFTLDWWPVRHQENQAAIPAFLQARNIDDVSFAIFYETWDLSFDEDRGYADMSAPGVRSAFVEDMAQIADTYFDHPSYLRVGGQPVVILYLTRVLTGDVAGAMADARAIWRERGYEPFVIADEVFWKVTASGAAPGTFTTTPQAGRVRLFNAITAYNPYESETTAHAGYGNQSRFLPDVAALYQRYRDATGGDVPIVPGVIPGYNDRGVRPRLRHHLIPRAWERGGEEGTFLAEMLRQVADPLVDPRVPMVMVTSWNEWNEDTGIEPIREAPATAADTAADGISRTDGAPYAGFGMRYLEVLRDHYVAIAGQVLDGRGEPLSGETVTAWRDGKVVALDVTDHTGRYTLSRAQVGSAPVYVVVDDQEQRVRPNERTTVEASFP